MSSTVYRDFSVEQRATDLLRLSPENGQEALDIGARDGYFSLLLADRFAKVTALDLTKPNIQHSKIRCVQGNAAQMSFADNAFDFVFCAEVLEHIPASNLLRVCQEIERVASKKILIGVPYKQDIRVGRTTCYTCGKENPPWGHVNSFDEQRIIELFRGCKIEALSFVGVTREQTNWLSAALMDYAGNPYGTYHQEEPCVHCGAQLLSPPERDLSQRIATKLAIYTRQFSQLFTKSRGNWMHVVLRKIESA